MQIQDYDKTKFYYGMSALINGVWYPVVNTDFETRDTVCQTLDGDKTFPVDSVSEFTKQIEKDKS